MYLCLFCAIISSCKDERMCNINPNYGNNVDSNRISIRDYTKKTIFVGDNIGNRPLTSQVVRVSGVEKYYMLDDEKMYIFDWENGHLCDSIILKKSGKLNNYSGFNVITEDSILLYNYSRKTIQYVNKKGEIFKTIELKNAKSLYTDIEALNYSKIQIINNNIIASGSTLGDTRDRRALRKSASVTINVSSVEAQSLLQYPEIYRKADWGGVYMNTVYHTSSSRYMFYSFPIDHNVYKVDILNRSVSSFFMGSKYCQCICSNSGDFLEEFMDKDKRIKYYLREHSYSMILYDEYRKQLIRVAEHPTEVMNEDGTFAKPFSIIISDMNGKILSESKIIEDAMELDLLNMHITKQGLVIALIQKDENIIVFKCFKL